LSIGIVVALSNKKSTDKDIDLRDFTWVNKFGYIKHLGEFNISWTNNNAPRADFPILNCKGFDEFYIYAWPTDAMEGTYNVTVLLSPILWAARVPYYGEGRWEFATTNQLNVPVIVKGANFYNDFQFMTNNSSIEIKGPYCQLALVAQSATTPSGWVQLSVDVYLAKR
jgi:hypothetical protein